MTDDKHNNQPSTGAEGRRKMTERVTDNESWRRAGVEGRQTTENNQPSMGVAKAGGSRRRERRTQQTLVDVHPPHHHLRG